jgi:hypothetical protein
MANFGCAIFTRHICDLGRALHQAIILLATARKYFNYVLFWG